MAHLEKNAAPLSAHNIHNGNVQKPSSRCKGHSGVSRAANQQTSLSHQPTLASNALKCNHASLPSAHSSTSSKTLEIYIWTSTEISGNSVPLPVCHHLIVAGFQGTDCGLASSAWLLEMRENLAAAL